MNLRWIATLGVLTLFGGVAIAQTGPGQRPMQHRMERHRTMMQQDLNLTNDQQAKIRQLRLDLEKKQTVVDPKIKLAHIAMKELMLADKPDRAGLEKQIKAISALQLEKKLNVVDHLFAVYTILTPEQQKDWKEHFGGKRMGLMDGGEHMGMMGGGADCMCGDGPRNRGDRPGGGPGREE